MPEPPAHTPESGLSAQQYDLLIRPNGTQYIFAIRRHAEGHWHEFRTLLSAFEYLERHLPQATPAPPARHELR